jgi:hypothetical protein
VLHRSPGAAVTDRALDLRPAELGVVVPLVLMLVGLSVWPALITDRSFPQGNAQQSITQQLEASRGYELTQTTTVFAESGP